MTASHHSGREVIHSRHNPLFKQLVKLAGSRRERAKAGLALLDGVHLIEACIDAGWQPEKLVVSEALDETPQLDEWIECCHGKAVWMAEALFREITEMECPTGILAVVAIPAAAAPRLDGCCLALDGVQDPGNVGSIMRTAAAAGVDQVWLSTGCADAWSPKVLRAGMGVHFSLPVLEKVDLVAALSQFKGKVAVTSLRQATPLYATDLRGDFAMVMGSEGGGVSAAVDALAKVRLTIPMKPGVESLNVGAATAVCLYERMRQQEFSNPG